MTSRPLRFSTRVVVVSTYLTLTAALAAAQPTAKPAAKVGSAEEQGRFIADARAATQRYVDKQRAIDDGFTRVGVEFPAMGEHWVSLARVMENVLDAKRPSILIYSNTARGPQLAGVAYSRLLRGREQPPAFPFTGAWHEHSGTVTQGSFPLSHASHPARGTSDGSSPEGDAPRFFVLHAWIWTSNPDGMFVTDNWSLPQHRVGLPVDHRLDRSVVRALALAQDDDEYHRLVLRTTLSLTDREDSVVARILDAQRLRATRAMSSSRAGERLAPRAEKELQATWNELWLALEGALPKRRRELKQVRDAL